MVFQSPVYVSTYDFILLRGRKKKSDAKMRCANYPGFSFSPTQQKPRQRMLDIRPNVSLLHDGLS